LALIILRKLSIHKREKKVYQGKNGLDYGVIEHSLLVGMIMFQPF